MEKSLDPETGRPVVVAPETSRRKPFAIALITLSLIYVLSSALNIVADVRSGEPFFASQSAVMDDVLVPFEAHIMSKCPDAKACLEELIIPTMMSVVDKVNFTLSYIGTPTPEDGVTCMHGPEECMGNIIELCAAHLYPDPKIYLGFTGCLTRDYNDIPQKELVQDCALEHGLDFDSLNQCASDGNSGKGLGWLRDSVNRSMEVGATVSCTVRLDEEVYCTHDGGKWADPCPGGSSVNDLIIKINKLYNKFNS